MSEDFRIVFLVISIIAVLGGFGPIIWPGSATYIWGGIMTAWIICVSIILLGWV